jgi:hypothetical protein
VKISPLKNTSTEAYLTAEEVRLVFRNFCLNHSWNSSYARVSVIILGLTRKLLDSYLKIAMWIPSEFSPTHYSLFSLYMNYMY